MTRTIAVIGGTSGIGLEIAKTVVARGDNVILTGRDPERTAEIAASIGPGATGLALDISEPETIVEALKPVGQIHGLVLAAIERDANSVREYNIARARRLVTLKLVGYTEVVHTLLDRLEPSVDTGIVLFGGRAKDAPYPGSTTVATINGGVEGLTRIPPQSRFLYVAAPADDPFTGALATNPLYRGLPFVAENRTTALDPGTWQFGGPASMMFLLDQAGRAFGV